MSYSGLITLAIRAKCSILSVTSEPALSDCTVLMLGSLLQQQQARAACVTAGFLFDSDDVGDAEPS